MNCYDCESYKSCTSFLEEKIVSVCQYEYKDFFKLPNVVGMGLGCKYIGGINTLKKCLCIMVKKKVPSNMLSKENIVPKFYNGIETDIYETGEFKNELADSNDKAVFGKKIRPVEGGYSIGSAFYKPAGSMTCLVTDGIDEFILASAHLLAPLNKLIVGTPLLQPALVDGGTYPEDEVGYIKTFIPIKYVTKTSEPENYVDAGLAKVVNRTLVSNRIARIGKLPPIYPFIEIGSHVYKIGRTTGVTEGFIMLAGATTSSSFGSEKAIFKNQIAVSTPSKPGDSGGILIRAFTYNPLGMLNGTSSSVSVYSPIGNVVNALGVHIL